MNNKQIYDFITELRDRLNDPNVPDIAITDDPSIGDRFKELGFVMDAGELFKQKYGDRTFDKCEELEKIIDSVDDIKVLGSAIFSKWRYYNHWAYSSIRDEEPMKWLELTIGKLLELLS